MTGDRRLLVRSLDQTERLPVGLVEPEREEAHPKCVLNGEVSSVCGTDVFLGDIAQVAMNVHVDRHVGEATPRMRS